MYDAVVNVEFVAMSPRLPAVEKFIGEMRAMFAVTPDQPSEPPHWSASMSSEAGTGSRCAVFAAGRILSTASTPWSTVLAKPPSCWIVITSGESSLSVVAAIMSSGWLTSHPRLRMT